MLESTVNLNTFCVRDESGNCDVLKTSEKFAMHLREYAASVKADNETIRTLIDSVYDMPGNSNKETLPITYVVNQVTGKLDMDGSVEAFNLATERVEAFIKGSGLYGSKKGPKGGLFRVGSVAPKAETKAA